MPEHTDRRAPEPDRRPPTITRPTSLAVTMHAETISSVRVVDLSNGIDRLVSLKLRDDLASVRGGSD